MPGSSHSSSNVALSSLMFCSSTAHGARRTVHGAWRIEHGSWSSASSTRDALSTTRSKATPPCYMLRTGPGPKERVRRYDSVMPEKQDGTGASSSASTTDDLPNSSRCGSFGKRSSDRTCGTSGCSGMARHDTRKQRQTADDTPPSCGAKSEKTKEVAHNREPVPWDQTPTRSR